MAEEGINPFDGESGTARINLIVQLRIYDVLMAILNGIDPEACAKLNEAHEQGRLIAELPWLDLSQDDRS